MLMIDIKWLLAILGGGGILGIAASVVTFFQMQTRQNMKIEQLEKDINALGKKLSDQTDYQIKTEKEIVKINTKLDNLIDLIKELKDKGCGKCP